MAIHREDVDGNKRIGKNGAELIPTGTTILTHCNAGALATGGYGTALGVIRAAHAQGKVERVLATETRPLLQGARLTAWELVADGIPASLIPDPSARSVSRAWPALSSQRARPSSPSRASSTRRTRR